MTGLVNWLLVLFVATIFVTVVREGPVHEAAWGEACRTIETGGAVRLAHQNESVQCPTPARRNR